LTYGDPGKSTVREPIDGPPAHPHCRCAVSPWLPSEIPGGVDLPEALRREARRAVLKGWSLDSESNAARLLAAGRLLERGPGMPESVEREARRAIRVGRFRSRKVPTP